MIKVSTNHKTYLFGFENMESKITEKEPIPTPTQMKKIKKRYLPRMGCLRIEENETEGVSLEVVTECNSSNGDRVVPTHLVIMVHGIIGSADNWKFAASQFLQRYPHDVVVHCSECNSGTLTFDGVDVMAERLAQEVMTVVNRRPKLQKISFVAHSLGGLVARYAIGRLYKQDILRESDEGNGVSFVGDKSKGKIAGLEPMNFITFATPHLGTRGHKQSTSAPILATDSRIEQANLKTIPPSLAMLKDMSALHSFQRRVTYSNARFDFIVGWRTSSIRRKHELPKLQRTSKNDRYPHIVNVEPPRTAIVEEEVHLKDKVKELKTSDMEDIPPAKQTVVATNCVKTMSYFFDEMDRQGTLDRDVSVVFDAEFMIQGLTRVGWERVDVSFRRSKQRFFAHSTIQVPSCIVLVISVVDTRENDRA
ncbi:hypothetical protein IFM89_035667 [Coptis chinensis]|uniref:DUF676 domain-containing protein n=1 Tax=Coptis chinensis TaxID=261450 RepID=A0A835IVC6_9MAGN|nr:hypothetical protein IFM89_035667 [Coptis chinensis]